MNKIRNNTFLLRQWVLTIVLILFALLLLAFNFAGEGPFRYVLPTVIALLVMIMVARFRAQVSTTEARLRKLLESGSVRALLDYYEAAFGKGLMADKDTYLAFSNALAYALFGQFDLGQAEIDKVNWIGRAPMVQAQRPLYCALRAYLERRDYHEGMRCAQEARALTDVWTGFPGTGTTLNLYDAAIEIGQALGGFGPVTTKRAVASLEARLSRSTVLLQLLIAWALAECYAKSGRIEEARKMRESLRMSAPFCRGLGLG